jgi:[ribulose-bisphosphate carboxylase]-lysine N-methyltransferase
VGAGSDAFLLESLFRNDAWGFLLKPVSLENETAVFSSMMDGCRCHLFLQLPHYDLRPV